MFRRSFLAWLAVASCVRAAVRNITVDDSGKDEISGNEITYYPTGAWKSAKDCNGCTAHPAETNLVGGTWHDSTFNKQPGSNDFPNQPLSASFQFEGTAVYVFCALAKSSSSPTGNSDMTFWIDDEIAGTFAKIAPGEAGYDYNVSVFSQDSLSPGRHNLTLQNGHVNGVKALVLLDYIVYTYDDDASSGDSASDGDTSNQTAGGSSSSDGDSNTTVIVATVVPIVCALALVAVGVFFWRRRKREVPNPSVRLASPEPFIDPAWASTGAPASQGQYASPAQDPFAQAPYGTTSVYAPHYSPTDAASSYYPAGAAGAAVAYGGTMTYPPSVSSHPSQPSEAGSWSASGLYRNPSQAPSSASHALSSGTGSAAHAYGSQVGYLPHHGKQIEVASTTSGQPSSHRTQPSGGISGSAAAISEHDEPSAPDVPPPAYDDEPSASTSAPEAVARQNPDRKR